LERALSKSNQTLTNNSSLLIEQKNLNLSLENDLKKKSIICNENDMQIENLKNQAFVLVYLIIH